MDSEQFWDYVNINLKTWICQIGLVKIFLLYISILGFIFHAASKSRKSPKKRHSFPELCNYVRFLYSVSNILLLIGDGN